MKFKKISILVLTICMILSFTVGGTFVKAATITPQVTFVGVDHSPLIVGDTETFYITAKNADKVQYRIFLYTEKTAKTEELTNGYTDVVDAKIPYEVSPSKTFALGKYRLITWVKAAGSTKQYDSTYTANLNCVNKDDNNRVYVNGAVDIEKTSYEVGEKVVVNDIQGISGIPGPYFYRLHLYNATTDTWVKNVTVYADKIEWIPTHAGTYVLDIYANTQKSTTWKNYDKKPNNSNTYGTYEAWKLKVITVKQDSSNNSNQVTPTVNPFIRSNVSTVSNVQDYKLINDVLYLKDMDDIGDSGVTPRYTLSSNFNDNLINQYYNMLDYLFENNCYSSLSYYSKTQHALSDNLVGIQYQKLANPPAGQVNKIMKTSWYVDDLSGKLNEFKEYAGYASYTFTEFGYLYNESEHFDKYKQFNKITLDEYANEISTYASNYFTEHQNSKTSAMERKTFGKYLVEVSATYNNRYGEYGDVQIFVRK